MKAWVVVFLAAFSVVRPWEFARAQNALPRVAYVFPPGGAPGITHDVALGGYDWTPDTRVFVHDPRVTIELTGALGPALVPPPPYWFGPKSFNSSPPIPREITAKITIPADFPPGPMAWQVANANGGSAAGAFIVGRPQVEERVEDQRPRVAPQSLDAFPVVVSGRLGKIGEVDRYRFSTPVDGPLTCRLDDRLGLAFGGTLEIRDANHRLIADRVDAASAGGEVHLWARAGQTYEARVYDLDFRGDRAQVYRLTLTQGPRVWAVIPAGGRRGETAAVDLLGFGLSESGSKFDRLTTTIAFPADPNVAFLDYAFENVWGKAPSLPLPMGDLSEVSEDQLVSEGDTRVLVGPTAVTGRLGGPNPDVYRLTAKQGESWRFSLSGVRPAGAADMELAIFDATGTELARSDDLPGTLDAGVDFLAPAEGDFRVEVASLDSFEAQSETEADQIVYRLLVVESASCRGAHVELPDHLDVPIGAAGSLPIKVAREPGCKSLLRFVIEGLPEGASAPAFVEIPADKSEIELPITVAADAPAGAALATVRFTPDSATPPPSISPSSWRTLVTTTMKPRCRIYPLEKDGGRTVHRGTTFPAEIVVERLEGFEGEILLTTLAQQERHRQGIRGEDLIVPAGASRAFFSVFLPEWLETNRTSRIVLVGWAKVPDPRGTPRIVASAMQGRVTMSIEGALMKLSADGSKRSASAGESFDVTFRLDRSPKLPLPAEISLLPDEFEPGLVSAAPVILSPEEQEATVRVSSQPAAVGKRRLKFRALAWQDGKLPVESEVELEVEFAAPSGS